MEDDTKQRLMKNPFLILTASAVASGISSAAIIFQTDFSEASIGDITGLNIDTPNTDLGTGNSGAIVLNTANDTLDFSANGANLWTAREGAPIAWVDSPILGSGETWYVETQVNMNDDPGGVQAGYDQAGITFYGGPDGANPGANDAFALLLNDWNNWGVQNAAFSVGGAANSSNGALANSDANIFLRTEITEGGATDTYNFFYKVNAGESWTQLGGIAIDRAGSFDNSRVGLVLKSHNNNENGAAQFNSFTVGTVDAIPEPSTSLLAGLAGLALSFRRSRK